MDLEQLEVQWDIVTIPEGSCIRLIFCHRLVVSGRDAQLCGVPGNRGVSALVMAVFSLLDCIPEVDVTLVDVTIIDGHDLIFADPHRRFFHDGPAQVLNHSPVGIGRVQSDREGQAGSCRDMRGKVGKLNPSCLGCL